MRRLPTSILAVAASSVLVAWGCAGPVPRGPVEWQGSRSAVSSSFDGSLLCQSLADRFLSLPAVSPLPWNDASATPAPSVGRWWVRHCSAHTLGDSLEVQLEGPGWYWIDESGSGIRLEQQVPFELGVALVGRLHQVIERGVLSLWFQPTAEPRVQLKSPPTLAVRSTNAWGALISVVPGVSPMSRAAQRFSRVFSQSLVAQLESGATFTYALGSGQSDASLGQLPAGTTPTRPFDESPWSVNERLLLAPGAVQVLGPIKRGAHQLNVIVERGPGLRYHTMCAPVLRDHFQAVRDGELASVRPESWVGGGVVEGRGEHVARLDVPNCDYFFVASSLEDTYTLAAVLVT